MGTLLKHLSSLSLLLSEEAAIGELSFLFSLQGH
jgi:hypothetical protein